MKEKLQKILSARGVASRRAAEKMIQEGRVRINGSAARLGDRADAETDTITVDGVPLPASKEKVYIILYKPRGYLTSVSDDRGRKTVMELLTGLETRVYPVGRLDLDSEGLLLLTNDGAFANRVMHPSGEKDKSYLVWVRGKLEDAEARLARPIVLDGRQIRPPAVRLLRERDGEACLSVTIHEGRNRQIRRMCEAAELHVRRLKRVSVGGLTLGSLRPGQWRRLTGEEAEKALLSRTVLQDEDVRIAE